MKKSIIYIILGLVLFSLFISIILIISVPKLIELDKKSKEHDYVMTTITDKYYIEGSTGFFFVQPTIFYIVSKSNDGTVWTSKVSDSLYNSLDIGDNVQICINHMLLEYQE